MTFKNKILQTILIAITLTFLFACGQSNSNNNVTQVDNTITDSQILTIDTFSKFPPEIDGCACYFSNNETEFESKKYIYADDYGNNSFVSINGVMNKFIISKSDTLPNNHSIELWTNDKYELTIDIQQVGQLDETWQQKGTLKLKSKSGQTIVKNIYGECGC